MNLTEHFASYRGAVKNDMLSGLVDFLSIEPSPVQHFSTAHEYLGFIVRECDTACKRNDTATYKHYLEEHQKTIVDACKKLCEIEFGGIKDPNERMLKILDSTDHEKKPDALKWWKFSDCVVKFEGGGHLIPRYSFDFDAVKNQEKPLCSVHEYSLMTNVYRLDKETTELIMKHKRESAKLRVFISLKPNGEIEMSDARDVNKNQINDWMMRLFP